MNLSKYSNIAKTLMRREYVHKINPISMVRVPNCQLLFVKKSLYQHKFLSTTSANYVNQSDIPETSEITNSLANSSSQQFGFIIDSPLTRISENFLIDLHELGGLEWSTTIFLAALLFRLSVCFPIKIYQEKLMAKLLNIQPIVNDAIRKNNKSNKKNSFMNSKKKDIFNKKDIQIRNEIYQKEGCLPQKIPLSSFLQLPFWIYLTSSIRNLTFGKFDHSLQMEQLTNSSFIWLESLTACDQHYILPAIYALSAFGSIQYASLNSPTNTNVSKLLSLRKYLTMTFICVITLLVSKMPASIGLFWIFSNSLSLAEIIILDSIAVKRLFGISKTSIEPKNIYAEKYKILLAKSSASSKYIKKIFK